MTEKKWIKYTKRRKKNENQKLINWKIYDCLSYNQVRPSTQYYFIATIKQTNNTWTWGNIKKKRMKSYNITKCMGYISCIKLKELEITKSKQKQGLFEKTQLKHHAIHTQTYNQRKTTMYHKKICLFILSICLCLSSSAFSIYST